MEYKEIRLTMRQKWTCIKSLDTFLEKLANADGNVSMDIRETRFDIINAFYHEGLYVVNLFDDNLVTLKSSLILYPINKANAKVVLRKIRKAIDM